MPLCDFANREIPTWPSLGLIPARDGPARGPIAERPADLPLVAEWVDDPANTPAVLFADG